MTAREQGAPQLIGSDYGAIADLYDYVTPYRRRPDVGFYVEAAQEWGGPVLEVGCGTGRVLIPTARTGLAVTGIDLSPAMLRVCRERLQQEPAAVRDRVQLIRADMRSFALGRTFPLATIPFRPFQHLLAVADQMACLRTIWRHLEEGGRLVLDVFNPSLEALVADNVGEQVGEAVSFTLPDGRQVVRRDRMLGKERFKQIIHIELSYTIGDAEGRQEQRQHTISLRYFFRYELEHLLARCGFEVEALYGGFDRSAYGESDPGELIFVARKVGAPARAVSN